MKTAAQTPLLVPEAGLLYNGATLLETGII
jgi:hypothetical protein